MSSDARHEKKVKKHKEKKKHRHRDIGGEEVLAAMNQEEKEVPAAAAGAPAPPAPPTSLPAQLAERGFEKRRKGPVVDLDGVMEGEQELWLLQLPPELELEALDNTTISMTGGAASSSGGRSSAPAVIGKVAIETEIAEEMDTATHFVLQQEGQAAVEPLFVVAPTSKSKGRLVTLPLTKRAALVDDAEHLNAQLFSHFQWQPRQQPQQQQDEDLDDEEEQEEDQQHRHAGVSRDAAANGGASGSGNKAAANVGVDAAGAKDKKRRKSKDRGDEADEVNRSFKKKHKRHKEKHM